MALDTFTRANEDPLDPTNWGGDVLARTMHELAIVSDKAVSANQGIGNSGSQLWLATPSSADHFSGVVPATNSTYYQVFIRLTGIGASTLDGYAIVVWSGGTNPSIYRYDNSVSTQIATASSTWAVSDSLELHGTGSTISLKQNGSTVASATDATYTGNGQIALLIGADPGGQVASFDGGPFATPPQTVNPSGLASEASFGAPTPLPGAVIASAAGLASASSFGAVTYTPGPVTVNPAGLASASSFGSPIPEGRITVDVSGLAGASSFGSPSIVPGPTTINIPGLGSEANFTSPNIEGGVVQTFNPAVMGRHRR